MKIENVDEYITLTMSYEEAREVLFSLNYVRWRGLMNGSAGIEALTQRIKDAIGDEDFLKWSKENVTL